MSQDLSFSSWAGLVICFFVIATVIRPLRLSFRGKVLILDFASTPLLAVATLLATCIVPPKVVVKGIVGDDNIQPWTIVILFYSLAYLCVSIDVTGLFSEIANRVIIKAGNGKGIHLWLAVWSLSSMLTIFTSNDIVILTLTPLIVHMTSFMAINPTPFLIAQFHAANTFSTLLQIGNPTNIIASQAQGVRFLDYSAWMALPTVVASLTSLLLLYLVFRKAIPDRVQRVHNDVQVDKPAAIFGVSVLAATLVTLVVTSFFEKIPMWLVTLPFAALVFFRDLMSDLQEYNVRRKKKNSIQFDKFHNWFDQAKSETAVELHDSSNHIREVPIDTSVRSFPTLRLVATRLPWAIAPFILGMFILVEALDYLGWVKVLAKGMLHIVGSTNVFQAAISTTFISAFLCNLLNSQPMTILMTRVFQHPEFMIVSPVIQEASMYGLILGSNFGTNVTLAGSLSGLMWISILKSKGIGADKMGFLIFFKYGMLMTPLVCLTSSLTLGAEFAITRGLK